MTRQAAPPDAEVLIASGCAHCPSVLAGLAELIEQGLIGRLEVINVGTHPDLAQTRGVRSVPWTRIGPFELPGSYSPAELRQWAERATSDTGMRDYFAELLETQRLPEALTLARRQPEYLSLLVGMIGDLETPMGVRIGIGAMFEELAESGELTAVLPQLATLTRAAQAPVRADAAYYLGLIGEPAATVLQPLLDDPDREVREIAGEALGNS